MQTQIAQPSFLKISKIVYALAGSLFLALTAQLSIPLPFTPVPITGQSLGVVLLGLTLPRQVAIGAVLAYLLEGSIGLPFFAGGAFGLARVLGPTGGFLLSFLPAVWVTGFLRDRKVSVFLNALLSHAVIFAIGCTWLSFYVGGAKAALAAGFLPFIPGTLIKTALLGISNRVFKVNS